LKQEVHLNNTVFTKFISYLIENTPNPHYKGQPVDIVYYENNQEHINTLWDLRFPQRWRWSIASSGMSHRVEIA
jgi:hypothetical protein